MGAGIAISGYCPGTSAGALGEGALDALFFMLGMLWQVGGEGVKFINSIPRQTGQTCHCR